MKKNNIYQGDCIFEMQKLKSESVNCILTDPPYKYLKNQKLETDFNENLFFNECKRVLKKDGFIVIFGRGTSFYRWNCLLADMDFVFKEEIIWDKGMISSPCTPISRVHETISIFTKKNGKIFKNKIPYLESRALDLNSICKDIKRLKQVLNNDSSLEIILEYLKTGQRLDTNVTKNISTHFATMSEKRIGDRNVGVMQSIKTGLIEKDIIKNVRDHYNTIHPTQKPVRLLERLLALVTKEGDMVLDPFSGSGSTTIACINTNRNSIAYEIDEEYFNNSIIRVRNYSN